MKKGMIALLVLLTGIFMTACGEEKEHSAERYHEIMESETAKYYYKASVESTYYDMGEDTEKSLKAEARDGKGNWVIATGTEELDTREIELGDYFYTVFDPDKEYTKEKKAEEESVELTYAGTSEMKLDGKTYKYDEYRDEFEMEWYGEEGEAPVKEKYLYIKRYLLDEQGKLYGILYRQEQEVGDGQKNKPIYQSLERISEFEENSFPDEIFQIPDTYKEVK